MIWWLNIFNRLKVALGILFYSGGRIVNASGVAIDPYEFTLAEFNNLVASDYAGVTVRVTNLHTTAAGVGGVLFTGGTTWTLESPHIYYATFATGIAAFPAASWTNLRMLFGDVNDRVVHISNGTRYVPDGGRFTFFKGVYGTVASPTLTATGTSYNLTLAASAPTIPANYLSIGDVIQVKARLQRRGTVAAAPTFVRLGTAGNSPDADLWAVTIANTNPIQLNVDCYATIGTATVFVTNSSAAQSGGGGTGQLSDKTTNFNIASALKFSVTGTKDNADSVDLLGLVVEIITTS